MMRLIIVYLNYFKNIYNYNYINLEKIFSFLMQINIDNREVV